MEVHIVQKGDTLWKIARQHGVSFEELKRVNAHLANPDYIVPGMKIMLPKKQGGQGKPHAPSHGGGPSHKPEHKPTHKPEHKPEHRPEHKPEHKPAPKPEHKPAPPVRPAPIPPAPVPPVRPAPVPPVPAPPVRPAPVPPAPVPPVRPAPVPPAPPVPPVPLPTPPAPQMPMHPMHPIPIIGIPCGWMPIFDADCHPCMHHHGHMHHLPPQQAPMYEQPAMPMPGPVPLPTPQLPVIELESEESPLYPGPGPIPMPKEWQQIESPICAESPEMEQPMMPLFEMQQGGCGPCQQGSHSHHQPSLSPCGCGHHYPMAPMPSFNHCHSCHQPMPHHMMPYYGHNWRGNY